MSFAESLRRVADRLDRTHEAHRAIIGFDGFVDEIIDVVATRSGPEEYTRIPTISAFGARISAAAGLSTNIELVPTHIKLGGNGPIMSLALAGFGIDLTYIGSVGRGTVHPVFEELAAKCTVYGLADPGYTHALEFDDGKLMLGKLTTLTELTWERVIETIPVERLRAIAEGASLIGALNWTMIPYLTELWERLLEEVIAKLPADRRPIAFFDLCDPQKREVAHLVRALRTIERFSEKTRPILGLNRKEANQVADALGLSLSRPSSEAPLEELTSAIAANLNVYGVVVHPTHEAAAVVAGEKARIDGPYTSKPKLTTGAGDNFNAGFCFGQVLGFSTEESLILGKGTSGFYVRNKRSPNKSELASFLRHWADHVGEDF